MHTQRMTRPPESHRPHNRPVHGERPGRRRRNPIRADIEVRKRKPRILTCGSPFSDTPVRSCSEINKPNKMKGSISDVILQRSPDRGGFGMVYA